MACCLFLLFFFLFCAVTAYGGQATLCWDPPTTNVDGTPLTDLGGYKIYYGTSSGNYPMTTDIYLGECVPCGGSHPECALCANACTYTVTGLTDGATYYFVATAYNTSGNESEYSNEVSKLVIADENEEDNIIQRIIEGII